VTIVLLAALYGALFTQGSLVARCSGKPRGGVGLTVVLVLCYCTLCMNALSVLDCRPTSPDDGHSYLAVVGPTLSADGRCYEQGGLQQRLQPWAVAALLLNGLGIPLQVWRILWAEIADDKERAIAEHLGGKVVVAQAVHQEEGGHDISSLQISAAPDHDDSVLTLTPLRWLLLSLLRKAAVVVLVSCAVQLQAKEAQGGTAWTRHAAQACLGLVSVVLLVTLAVHVAYLRCLPEEVQVGGAPHAAGDNPSICRTNCCCWIDADMLAHLLRSADGRETASLLVLVFASLCLFAAAWTNASSGGGDAYPQFVALSALLVLGTLASLCWAAWVARGLWHIPLCLRLCLCTCINAQHLQVFRDR